MDPRIRDGVLACLGLAVFLEGLRRQSSVDALRDPVAATAGVVAALLVEWAFLRYPERLLSWWERPVVHRTSSLGVCCGAALARRRSRLLAAGAWGLGTYLALLGRLLLRQHRDGPAAARRQPDR